MDRDTIEQAVSTYNRYHSPEATAEPVKLTNNYVTVRFHGPFCASRGVNEYFEDFKFELMNLIEAPVEIEGAEQESGESEDNN